MGNASERGQHSDNQADNTTKTSDNITTTTNRTSSINQCVQPLTTSPDDSLHACSSQSLDLSNMQTDSQLHAGVESLADSTTSHQDIVEDSQSVPDSSPQPDSPSSQDGYTQVDEVQYVRNGKKINIFLKFYDQLTGKHTRKYVCAVPASAIPESELGKRKTRKAKRLDNPHNKHADQ